MKNKTATAAWLFFFFRALTSRTFSMATVQPTKQQSMLIVQRRNIVRRGNLVTTSAAMVPLMKPQHWLATAQSSVQDSSVSWESVSAKWRLAIDSRLCIHSVVSDHAKDCAQIVRNECISRHLGKQAHHGCNEHTAAHPSCLEHVKPGLLSVLEFKLNRRLDLSHLSSYEN
jgi:hypothetical protein